MVLFESCDYSWSFLFGHFCHYHRGPVGRVFWLSAKFLIFCLFCNWIGCFCSLCQIKDYLHLFSSVKGLFGREIHQERVELTFEYTSSFIIWCHAVTCFLFRGFLAPCGQLRHAGDFLLSFIFFALIWFVWVAFPGLIAFSADVESIPTIGNRPPRVSRYLCRPPWFTFICQCSSGMGAPASSYATAGTLLGLKATKPPHQFKVLVIKQHTNRLI